MATIKEKDDMIQTLKDKIRSLEQLVKPEEQLDLSKKGMSIVKKEGKFYLIEIGLDLEANKAVIVSNKMVADDYLVALYKGKQYLVEQILTIDKSKKGVE